MPTCTAIRAGFAVPMAKAHRPLVVHGATVCGRRSGKIQAHGDPSREHFHVLDYKTTWPEFKDI